MHGELSNLRLLHGRSGNLCDLLWKVSTLFVVRMGLIFWGCVSLSLEPHHCPLGGIRKIVINVARHVRLSILPRPNSQWHKGFVCFKLWTTTLTVQYCSPPGVKSSFLLEVVLYLNSTFCYLPDRLYLRWWKLIIIRTKQQHFSIVYSK